ncbi:MAG: NAD-dependent epimerase/dehydratase family protein [Actinomycetales bacterium]|nr:NAD-dependent epimerase/dehydratase family protein [Actinomycetales bacterium]
MGRVVLVTGVSGCVGRLLAQALAAEAGVDRVIGVDVATPPSPPVGVDVVRADLRDVARVFAGAAVDTVVVAHLAPSPPGGRGRVAVREANVIGSFHLLAACQKAEGLRRLVVASSAAVYGASPRDPALFTEDTVAKVMPVSGWGRDCIEVEGDVRGFSRRRPDVGVVTLRLADVVGPGIVTPLTRHLSLPAVPTVLGFDPRLQFLHVDDAVAALHLATTGTVTGTVNVAGDGVLLLSQVVRMTGRPAAPVPPPLTGAVGRVLRRFGSGDLSVDAVRFLRHGRGLDTTRMRTVLGFEPKLTSRDAFADFVEAACLCGPLSSGSVATAERRILDLLGRFTAPVTAGEARVATGVRAGDGAGR